LSAEELQDIYEGKEVIDSQLIVLSRILGKSVEELTEVRDGLKQADQNRGRGIIFPLDPT
jgi:hypothetical protein